jgi:hypothetical protein
MWWCDNPQYSSGQQFPGDGGRGGHLEICLGPSFQKYVQHFQTKVDSQKFLLLTVIDKLGIQRVGHPAHMNSI